MAYALSYLGKCNFSSCRNSLIESGLITNDFSGVISASYLIIYGAGQFISGRMGVKISPKTMVGVGLFGSGCMNILMGVNSSPWLFVIIWALNGFFCSMLWSPIIRIFAEWMEAGPRYRAGANFSLSTPAGMIGSYLLSSFLLSLGDWRMVFIICGISLCLSSAVWLLGLGAIKEQVMLTAKKVAEEAQALLDASGKSEDEKKKLSLKIFLGTGLLIVAVVALLNGALKDSVVDWIQKYLIDTFGVSDSMASLISTLLPIFTIAGPYIGIWLDKHIFHNEIMTSFALFLATTASLACIFIPGLSSPIFSVIMLGTAMSLMRGVNSMVMTYVPYRYGHLGISSSVSGVMTGLAYISASSGEIIYGKVASGGNWDGTILVWTGVAVFGTIFCLATGKIWGKKRPQTLS
jgi:OPA family glycerol-3-phosphate transporter-like MFS transporter